MIIIMIPEGVEARALFKANAITGDSNNDTNASSSSLALVILSLS